MRIGIGTSVLWLFVCLAGTGRAQVNPGNPERLSELRARADRFRTVYEQIDSDARKKIEKLLASRDCRKQDVDILLNDAGEALDRWTSAERQYLASSNDAEAPHMEEQQKSLDEINEELKSAKALLEAAKEGNDSERIDKLQQTYDAISLKAAGMRALIDAQLAQISRNRHAAELYAREMKEFYAKTRATAVTVCRAP